MQPSTGVQRIPGIAADQSGVFTAQQALDEGWTGRQIRRRLVNGHWHYVAGKGLAVPGAAGWSAHQLSVAAQLTVPTAVTSHLTAGAVQGFPLPADPRSHITSTKEHRNLRNIVTHRVAVTSAEVMVLDGLVAVTTPERTAADCLSILEPDEQLRLWAWLSTRQIMDITGLEGVIKDRQGHPGVTRLRALLALVRDGAVSVAEHRFLQLLREARITGWRAGVTIQDAAEIIAVADVLFDGARLVIEIDGFGSHQSRDAFVRDRRRQNRLVNAGYTVLRFTWDDLTRRPEQVIAQVRQSLTRLTR